MLPRGSCTEHGLHLSHHGSDLVQAGVWCDGGAGLFYPTPQCLKLMIHVSQLRAVLHPEVHLIHNRVELWEADPVCSASVQAVLHHIHTLTQGAGEHRCIHHGKLYRVVLALRDSRPGWGIDT